MGTLFNQIVPLEYMGRTSTVFNLAVTVFIPIGQMIFGYLYDILLPSYVILLSGIIMLIGIFRYKSTLLKIDGVLIFKNLGDKTRYEVVKLIATGESSTKKIATALEVSSATISYHLSALVTAKIIRLDKSNNKFRYVLDWDSIESAFNSLKEDMGMNL